MPVGQEPWILRPLGVVQELFKQSDGATESWGVHEFFSSKLSAEGALEKVPSLNDCTLDSLPNGSLVRYRCMVQDQLASELCLKAYTATHPISGDKVKCFGMYRDLLEHPVDYEVDYEAPSNIHEDRQTLYCVPVPAETTWARAAFSSCGHNESGDSKPTGEGRRHVKRQLSEEEEEVVEEEERMDVEDDAVVISGKRQRREGEEKDLADGKSSSSASVDLNFPLPSERGRPCLVKVYGEDQQFKVTEMVEFIGVLSADPALTHFETEREGEEGGVGGSPFAAETAAERKAHSPPPSLTPRLHCILAHKLSHSHPLLPPTLAIPLSTLPPPPIDFQTCRGVVLDILTRCLSGDRLAAEYTLLHLISSVYGRTEVLALGKFSLNLTRCHTSFSNTVSSVLEELLPKCVLLPLSLSNMNSLRFSPKKDYSANRLLAGILQLSAGTHLVLDETALAPGHLGEVGVRNLTALGNVVQWQKVSYDFQYHTLEFECDLPVLVLSEGKSIITTDCLLPLHSSTPHNHEAVLGFLTALPIATLFDVRRYLGLARLLDYQLSAGTRKELEEDFVEMRKSNSEMSAETFHHLLTLARLVSLSYGCRELSQEHWLHTKQLERQRRDRLQ